mgnify:CR=1 FL=1|jgi:hypothetical protein|tara:strand:- start:887 stop:1081 length:195 start_codon:yes stop_codon:yes gene_type:complete
MKNKDLVEVVDKYNMDGFLIERTIDGVLVELDDWFKEHPVVHILNPPRDAVWAAEKKYLHKKEI